MGLNTSIHKRAGSSSWTSRISFWPLRNDVTAPVWRKGFHIIYELESMFERFGLFCFSLGPAFDAQEERSEIPFGWHGLLLVCIACAMSFSCYISKFGVYLMFWLLFHKV